MIGMIILASFMILGWLTTEIIFVNQWMKRLEKARKLIDEADALLVELMTEIEETINLREQEND